MTSVNEGTAEEGPEDCSGGMVPILEVGVGGGVGDIFLRLWDRSMIDYLVSKLMFGPRVRAEALRMLDILHFDNKLSKPLAQTKNTKDASAYRRVIILMYDDCIRQYLCQVFREQSLS